MTHTPDASPSRLGRRELLGAAAGLATTAWAGTASAAEKPGVYTVKNGRINQSIVQWCFEVFGEKWTVEQTAQHAKTLGCKSIELVAPEHFDTLKKHGLTCAIASIDMAPNPPFVQGFNNPKYWPKVMKATKDAIDAAKSFGVENVIAFTGMAEDIPADVGLENCVKGFKKILPYAEKAGVTLCLEMLNTRDDSHPMKGHPGYQGDGTEYCIDILKEVESDHLKLLFDVYHVQIMDGDVIRRIKQHKDWIGHVHTAGNPGRGELDANQEINYPPIMQALVDVGYKGFVGQEFIPTRNPLAGLSQAVQLCDV